MFKVKAGLIFCMLMGCTSCILGAISAEDLGLKIVIMIGLVCFCFVCLATLWELQSDDGLQTNAILNKEEKDDSKQIFDG